MSRNGNDRRKERRERRGGLASYVRLKRLNSFERPQGADLSIGLIRGHWPCVRISYVAHAKMRALVQECNIEVGWLCSCSELPGGDILIEDVFVPNQICSIATTTITKDGEAQMLTDLLLSGQKDVVKKLRCWGHSHVNMQVFASGQDDSQTERFLQKGHPYFVRLIANKRNELYCSLYLKDENLVLHNVPLILAPAPTKKYEEWAQKEISEKVVEEIFNASSRSLHGNIFGPLDLSPEMIAVWRDLNYIDEEVYNELYQQLVKPEEITP